MSSDELLIRRAEVDGAVVDVLVRQGLVTAIGHDLPRSDVLTVEADAGALMPGLHDHHIHLLAAAAVHGSIQLGSVEDIDGLREALGHAPRDWIRGVGYHEDIAGPLDRRVLDRLMPDRPVRIQHRSGALWILNSPALAQVSLDDSPDVERDGTGRPTGRLWRYDARLRSALPPEAQVEIELGEVGRELLAHGVTSVTDATPALEPSAIEALTSAHASGLLPQRVLLLGAQNDAKLPPGWGIGPWKVHLRDHDLPTVTRLAEEISAQHGHGRPVAVHCVSAESLLLTVAALQNVGAVAGDRVEHAGVVLPGLARALAELGVAVITQPGFVRSRGDAYLREVPAGELPYLYPYRSLLDAGIRVAPSSDSPYAVADPWSAVATARDRLTSSGQRLGIQEAVPAATALAGFHSPALDPGGRSRRVEPGVRADLCLLHTPLSQALRSAPSVQVRAVLVGGRFHGIGHGGNETANRSRP